MDSKRIDIESLSEEQQDLMYDMLGTNEYLYNLMLENKDLFNCIINNLELFEFCRDNPNETRKFFEKEHFKRRLIQKPKENFVLMKKSIERNKKNNESDLLDDNNQINKEEKENDKEKDKENDEENDEENENLKNNKSIDEKKIENQNLENNKEEDEKIKSKEEEKKGNERHTTVNISNNNILDDFIYLYFILIINRKGFDDIKVLVNKDSKNIECQYKSKESIIYKEKEYLILLYESKIPKSNSLSKNCIIKLKSERYDNFFFNDKQTDLKSDMNILFEDFHFKQIKNWFKTIDPPDCLSIKENYLYDLYYDFSKKSNLRFKKELFEIGYQKIDEIKRRNGKYSINFFLKVLSFILDDKDKFSDTIDNYFDIKFIEDNVFDEDSKLIFKDIVNFKDSNINLLKNDVILKLEILITFGYLILLDINSAIEFISKAINKKNLISDLELNLEYFKEEIYNKNLLHFLLKNCSKKNIFPIKLIKKCLSFKDFIELVNEFNDLFTEEELDINCENYKFEDYGKIEEIFPKIINILKNCPKFYLKSESILNKYPNLIEKLSKQEKKELFQLIKNEKDPIKKALMNKIFEEATDNDEIISLIDIFILWEKPDIYDILEKEINKLNFQSMSKECSEKFSKLFKNFGFFRSKGKFDENNYDKNIFFIILSKLQNIHEFPDIFWNLFEPNMLYNFTNDENNLFYSTYQELFQKNSIEDNRNNLFKLTNGILQWLISNKIKLCDFFNDLEQKLKSDKEEENLITQKFITNTYIEFLVNYNKNQLISDYIINYLKTKIEKLNKENLEKILNLENESQKILQFFIPYKLTRQNFFENENENIKLFKLIKSIPQNKYIINSIYYQNSLEIIKNIGLKLQTFTCSYQELLQITKWSDEELKSRIEILELNSELKNFLKTKIKEKINFYGDIIEKLSLSSEYFKKIEATDNEDKKYKQKINYLKSTFADNKNLEDKTLDKVDDYLKKDDFSVHLNKLSKRAKNFQIFQKFECGKMFIKSVNFKLEKEETKYQEISLNINKMKDIFYQDTILQMNDDKIMDFLNLFSSEKSFLEELNSLKNFFQIENEETDEFLRLNFKIEFIKKIVLSYIQTIQKLNISPVIFKDIQNIKLRLLELEKSKKTFDEEEMKNNFSILNQIISDFESMGDLIKLKIEPIDKISSILYNLWDNNIFDFLFNITNNDIRDLTNSLTGTLVDSNDIDNYLKVKQLIVFLKKEANYHPKNFEEEIDELINENNTEINYEIKKDIEFFGSLLIEIDSFLNEMKISDINQLIKETSKKKLHVNELLKNRKGYEKNREEINLIMNESKIEIYYIENQDNKSEEEKIGYNCKIIFSNSKIKYLDYIIELQQIASLSQNKNQDNHIFISFIEIVDKIKDLINYCSILTAKGFPDIFKFEIEIKKEVETFIDLTYEKKEKNFENQKNEMKNILKIMDDLQSNAYKNSCYLKFFSGQQLFKINNYIKNKIGNDDEKNSEIKHLLTHLMGDDFSKFNIDYIYRQSIPSSKFENFQTENCPFDIDDNYNEKDENEENIINTDRLNNNNEEMINMKDFENLGNDEKKMIITMNDMFMNIEKYLTKMIKENNLNEEKIFEKSIVTNPDYKKKKGIFIFGNKMIYSQTIKFYKGIVGNNPPRYSILFCNEETTLEELLAFLYLSLMCKYHSLFIILKPDQLQISLKIFLQEKIEKMYDDNIEIESLIIILFNDIGKSDIGKELINMRNIKKIEEPNILLDTINEIEVVSSSLAGYGKSTYIKKEFEKKYEKELKNGSFKYIQFPLGGEVKRSIILRRLKDLNINHDFSYGLHLDLSETNQIELFEDFLFSFLILKEYTQNEDIFCYQKNVEIKIEIPKGFYDFSEKFNLLKLFKQKKITSLPEFKILNDLDKNFDDENDIKKDKKLYENYKKNISYFNYLQTTLDSKIIPKEIIDLRKNHRYLYQSDIQIVCNYLDLYDSNKELLRKKNIFFYSFAQIDYELDENDWYYYSKFIDEKKCGELIQKYLKIPNCSYHQINIFIKVLCHQLKLFSNNYNLMAETLYAGEIDGIIRENLIKAFLNLTQFFTIGAFNELVTEQKDSISNYNEDIIKKSIEALEAKEKTINFEILNENSLVCIDEDGQSITILTNCAHDSKEYKDLENLLNMGRNFKENEKRLRLIDFTSNENDNNNFDEKISEDEKAIPNFKFLKIIKKYLCLKDDEKKNERKNWFLYFHSR